jgi:hypothetical protein
VVGADNPETFRPLVSARDEPHECPLTTGESKDAEHARLANPNRIMRCVKNGRALRGRAETVVSKHALMPIRTDEPSTSDPTGQRVRGTRHALLVASKSWPATRREVCNNAIFTCD